MRTLNILVSLPPRMRANHCVLHLIMKICMWFEIAKHSQFTIIGTNTTESEAKLYIHIQLYFHSHLAPVSSCFQLQVLEETGYNITSLLDPNIYLETSIGEQFVRLYIIPGVPTSTQFVPRTKGEIKQVKWFPVNQLPAHKNDRTFSKTNGSTNMFYMVMPFVK